MALYMSSRNFVWLFSPFKAIWWVTPLVHQGNLVGLNSLELFPPPEAILWVKFCGLHILSCSVLSWQFNGLKIYFELFSDFFQ